MRKSQLGNKVISWGACRGFREFGSDNRYITSFHTLILSRSRSSKGIKRHLALFKTHNYVYRVVLYIVILLNMLPVHIYVSACIVMCAYFGTLV